MYLYHVINIPIIVGKRGSAKARLPREKISSKYCNFMFVKESFKGSSCTATMVAARIKLSPIGIVVIGLVVVAIIYYLSTDGGRGEFSHKYFEGEDTVSMKRLIITAIHLAEKGGDVVRKIRLGEDLGVRFFSNLSLPFNSWRSFFLLHYTQGELLVALCLLCFVLSIYI